MKQDSVTNYTVDNKVIAVTHNGVFHSDDVFASGLIRCIGKKLGIKIEQVRTRDLNEVPEKALVYDVFDGLYDHHDKDGLVARGRKLAAFGKLFGALKNEIIQIFDLDEQAWINIDLSLVSSIDHSDNTGESNPLTYVYNILARKDERDPTSNEVFEMAVDSAVKVLEAAFQFEAKGAADRRILKSLPIVEVNGKKFGLKEEPGYISTPTTWEGLDGFIIRMGDDEVAGKWMVKMVNGGALSKCGLRNTGDVVFTHQSGFMGKMNTLDAVYDCI